MNFQSKVNDGSHEESFSPEHYIKSSHALVEMLQDRKQLYPNDRYVQLALDHMIHSVQNEIQEVSATQPAFLTVFFAPEELDDLNLRTELRRYAS